MHRKYGRTLSTLAAGDLANVRGGCPGDPSNGGGSYWVVSGTGAAPQFAMPGSSMSGPGMSDPGMSGSFGAPAGDGDDQPSLLSGLGL